MKRPDISMRLSHLVGYLNHVASLDTVTARSLLTTGVDPIIHDVLSHELQFGDIPSNIKRIRLSIDHSLDELDSTLLNLIEMIKINISLWEPWYLAQSLHFYQTTLINNDNEQILARVPVLPSNIKAKVRARILQHNSWQHPAMIFRPANESWINDMVSFDPMYVVDTNHELLQTCLARFPQDYRDKVRKYTIDERKSGSKFDALPKNQLALIVVYNYFSYTPLEVICEQLKELFEYLKPGGTLMFTFNNCDRYGAVDLVDRHYMCYTPGRLLYPELESAGYSITNKFDIDAAATWVELRKPGVLSSRKTAPAVFKIIENS